MPRHRSRFAIALGAMAAAAMALSILSPTPASAEPADEATTAAAPDINVEDVKTHLSQFQSIASSNGGTRVAGSAGYDRSVDYVATALSNAGFQVTRQTCTSCNGSDQNVIADWPGGNTSTTIMFGAHLDSVSAGPGINDNASGSAALLEVALTLAEVKPTVAKHLRFAWWADEESGLRGSNYYVRTSGVSGIQAYVNLDMVGSTNAGYFVDNINGTYSAPFKNYFSSVGRAADEMGECCSDDGPFRNAGVPTSFLSTGASARKTTTQAQKWGGTAGQSFDPCYHQRCDSYPSNINVTAINHMADATAYGLWELAVDDDTQPPEGCANTNDADVAITDLATVTSSLGIAECGRQGGTASTVEVHIDHTWRGDLVLRLLAPDGTSYLLEDFNNNDQTDNVDKTYTVNLSGEAADGSWRLSVQDIARNDVGKIDTWTLTV
ncbi:M28 family peptidase [Stackebrandtia nassauensis]|uniref:Peptidase M28 n=1 Tax=Stackebrandtia nassauensis (strain DSM 44728 / CIP 108903 / NRRL B-16338 / NBRC 102104 / LLR-40K-21) TaxID=446470 RepID=D3PWW7_STANL|nr:M28 family peptidase [Stackebrandtia nassauensis]ADD45191.1 peptidase M28 [Stackebrandtia nassauensis DSM 44728]